MNRDASREHKKFMKLVQRVSARLGVSRKKSVLFPAVAAALGAIWDGTRGHGYYLVKLLAIRDGIQGRGNIAKTAKPKPIVPAVASDTFLLSYEWRRLRMEVIKKRGARCECCGATPADGKTVINVDHIKPRRKFPELALSESNLQVLCSPCNHGKGNWDETDWRADTPVAVPPMARQCHGL